MISATRISATDFRPDVALFCDFGFSSEVFSASLRSYQNRPSFERSFRNPYFWKSASLSCAMGSLAIPELLVMRNCVIVRDLDESEEFRTVEVSHRALPGFGSILSLFRAAERSVCLCLEGRAEGHRASHHNQPSASIHVYFVSLRGRHTPRSQASIPKLPYAPGRPISTSAAGL